MAPFVDEFKIRGSWGKLGNSDAFNYGNYEYITQLAAGAAYPFNGVRNCSFYQKAWRLLIRFGRSSLLPISAQTLLC